MHSWLTLRCLPHGVTPCPTSADLNTQLGQRSPRGLSAPDPSRACPGSRWSVRAPTDLGGAERDQAPNALHPDRAALPYHLPRLFRCRAFLPNEVRLSGGP